MEEILGWKKESHETLPDNPASADMEAFEERISVGPTKNDFRVNWGSVRNDWNVQASIVFSDHFLELVKEGRWAKNSLPDTLLHRNHISMLFMQKLTYLRTIRTHQLIRIHGNPADKEALELLESQREKRNRRRSRRKAASHPTVYGLYYNNPNVVYFSSTL